jgi:hypothetical protein
LTEFFGSEGLRGVLSAYFFWLGMGVLIRRLGGFRAHMIPKLRFSRQWDGINRLLLLCLLSWLQFWCPIVLLVCSVVRTDSVAWRPSAGNMEVRR